MLFSGADAPGQYNDGLIQRAAIQGEVTTQACGHPAREKARMTTMAPGSKLLYDGVGPATMAFRESAPVVTLGAGAEAGADGVKLAVATTLSSLVVPFDTPVMRGLPSLKDALAEADEGARARMLEGILCALEALYRVAGVPYNTMPLDHGAKNSSNITLRVRGVMSFINTSHDHLRVGDAVRLGFPLPAGWPRAPHSNRPTVMTEKNLPSNVTPQLIRVEGDAGWAPLVEAQLGADGGADEFYADTGNLLARGEAGKLANALLALLRGGVISINPAFGGTVATSATFWNSAAGQRALGDMAGPGAAGAAGAAAGAAIDPGTVIGGLVGESSAMRNGLFRAMYGSGPGPRVRSGDMGSEADAAMVRSQVENAFADACVGYDAATRRNGLYGSVLTSSAAVGDAVDVDVTGPRT